MFDDGRKGRRERQTTFESRRTPRGVRAFPAAMASYLTSSHWMVTVPNELGSSKATLDCIAKGMQTAGEGRDLGGVSLCWQGIIR